jgi:hypothetical protein
MLPRESDIQEDIHKGERFVLILSPPATVARRSPSSPRRSEALLAGAGTSSVQARFSLGLLPVSLWLSAIGRPSVTMAKIRWTTGLLCLLALLAMEVWSGAFFSLNKACLGSARRLRSDPLSLHFFNLCFSEYGLYQLCCNCVILLIY